MWYNYPTLEKEQFKTKKKEREIDKNLFFPVNCFSITAYGDKLLDTPRFPKKSL